MVFMQPLADGSFAELSRRPNAPSRNEPLALYMMDYADLLFQQKEELQGQQATDLFPLLVNIYFKALSHHNELPALNLRIMWSLLAVNRDVESISFAYSCLAWPSLKFTPEIWLSCRDSAYDEIDIGVDDDDEDHGSNDGDRAINGIVAPHLGLLFIKTKVVQELKEKRAQCRLVLQTTLGKMLNPVQMLLEEFLGVSKVLEEQESHLAKLWESWDRRFANTTDRDLWRQECQLLSLLISSEDKEACDLVSLSDRQVVLALLSKSPSNPS
eukprot:CAMPEP_0168741654 /NCGR_PEP_ID=MMETSP0724-20121128/12631_1 /TAXON_ID=265536 /ORGANISM="Amphiprora sp., Strain CCMP467" /LENGTH=269 /DNA_ID=CAMNT_0008789177 /DNA_START=137 /DNA_END=942 /DNA_ORIENTATION=-